MCAQFSTNNLFLNCFRCWCLMLLLSLALSLHCGCCCDYSVISFIRLFWIILIFVFIVYANALEIMHTHTLTYVRKPPNKSDSNGRLKTKQNPTNNGTHTLKKIRINVNNAKRSRKALEPEMCNDETRNAAKTTS